MNARPLKVLLAIEDRATLRYCARLLAAFGYNVASAASLQRAGEMLRADRPDVLIVGAASHEVAVGLARTATEADGEPLLTLLIVEQQAPAALVAALEAGVDDFLSTPLDSAELLARLRTAARVLEFEHRFVRVRPTPADGDLLDRQAFLQRLHALLQTHGSSGRVACLVVQGDTYSELRLLWGLMEARQAEDDLLQRLMQCEAACRARLDPQRFALVLNATPAEAVEHAQRLRAAVAEFKAAAEGFPWTVSVGVACAGAMSPNASELLDRAEKALALAQQSGGNEVSTYEDVLEAERRWADLAGGRLFADAVLRNFMVPCPRLLRTSDALEDAQALLAATKLSALPVVDEEGKLAGLFSADRMPPGLSKLERVSVAQAMDKQAVSFDEATALPVLLDYFSQESPPVVVVVHKGRPTGLLTPESLAKLVEPLTTDSFAAGRGTAGASGLVVPHVGTAS